MCDWRRWIWPGILATALLTLLAVWFKGPAIEKDLGDRVAQAQGAHPWATTQFDGRDAVISGAAPGEEAQAAALDAARQTYGVRVARNSSELLALSDPYVMTAVKDASGVKLTGHYPDNATHDAIKAAAASAFPGLAVTSEMTPARGAPPTFSDATGFAMAELAGLSAGEASLNGTSFSLKGFVEDEAAVNSITADLSAELPAGLKLGTLDISLSAAAKAAAEAAAKAAAAAAAAKPAMTQQQTCQSALVAELADDRINFRTARAEIDQSSFGLLDAIAVALKGCKDMGIEVSGHTDSDGSDASNLRLSQARAKAVVDYLASKGTDVTKLEAVGYGEARPLAPNDTPENKAKNRRIEFTVKQ